MARTLAGLLVTLATVVTVGCASGPTPSPRAVPPPAPEIESIRGSHRVVEVDLTREATGSSYALVQEGEVLSRAPAEGRRLVFTLPEAPGAGDPDGVETSLHESPLYVEDAGGDRVRLAAGGTLFRHPLWSAWAACVDELRVREREQEVLARELESLQASLVGARGFRTARDVHREDDCDALGSEMPPTACEPGDRQRPVGLCAAVFGSCEAVSAMAPGFLSKALLGQTCGVVVAELQGREYLLEDMFGTFLINATDAAADSMLQSENPFEVMLGLVLRGGTTLVKLEQLDQCIRIAETRCRREYDAWWSATGAERNACREHFRILATVPSRQAEVEVRLARLGPAVAAGRAYTGRFADVGLHQVHPELHRPPLLDEPACLDYRPAGPVDGGPGTAAVEPPGVGEPGSELDARLHELLAESPSVSEADRRYWLSRLPDLDEARKRSLLEILERERSQLEELREGP